MTAQPLPRIPIAGPSITDKEIAYVTDAVTHAWYERAGEYVGRLEAAFAAHAGRRYAASLPSGTSGLHLSLAALGIGPGDEVIVPEITWIASAAPISYVGATPVFADIDPDTWCLSVASFEENITPRTRAVIPVDLYGGMPDMDGVTAVAAKHGIAIIEDAAEAFGSRYRGKLAGAFGTTSVFSFHGSKTMTTGEGGMVVTDDDGVYARIMILRDHGRRPSDFQFQNEEIGFKYKMSALQAALGLAQLERVDELVRQKIQIFRWYEQHLGDWPGVRLNVEPPGVLNSYWMTTIVLDPALGFTKQQLGAALAERGIDTRPFFNPLSSLPAYRNAADHHRARKMNHVSYGISPFALNLPSALRLEKSDVDRVATSIKSLLGRRSNASRRSVRSR